MLSVTEAVTIVKQRSYTNKRGKTVNLLVYAPATGDGGMHEVFIPDALDRDAVPAPGELCSLYLELYLYPGVGHRQDGSAFGTYEEGRRLAGYGPAVMVELPAELAKAA
jgi:hypothetical protein